LFCEISVFFLRFFQKRLDKFNKICGVATGSVKTKGGYIMLYSNYQKSKLNDIIVDVSMNSEFFRNPNSDFTRKRKLGFITTFKTILAMGGKTLDKELYDLFEFCKSIPSKSALVQRRDKILPEAFVHAFYEYSRQLRRFNKWHGYNLLAVDGSRINIARNPHDHDSYAARKKGKGFNALVLSTVYDLLNTQYTDAIIQGFNSQDERDALINMIPNLFDNSIIIADRGYESYNVFAHFLESNQKFVIRVKDIDSNGILSGFDLPDKEFDETITVNITKSQKKCYNSLMNYRLSPTSARFDFFTESDPVYSLTFRVVRLHLGEGKYQSLITNLSSDFTPDDLRYLYKLRWGIETSYRELKYSVGLVNFHAKKKDSIIQEIFARLTLHNFSKSIVQNIILMNRDTTHDYKINFVMAVYICRRSLRPVNTISYNIEARILKYLTPIRMDRSFERNIKIQSYTSFIYRVS